MRSPAGDPASARIAALRQELTAALKQYHQSRHEGQFLEKPYLAADPPDEGISGGWWQAFSTSSKGAIVVFDLDLQYLYANSQWLHLYQLGEIPREASHLELFPTERGFWEDLLSQGLLGASSALTGLQLSQSRHLKPWFICEWIPWQREGEVAGFIMKVWDHRREKQAIQKVKDLEKRLDLTEKMGQISLGYWQFPRDWIQLEGKLATRIGLEPLKRHPFARFYERIYEADRQPMSYYWEEPWEKGEGLDREFRMVDVNGDLRHCWERIDFERNPSGEIRRAVSVIRDITELRQTQSSLEESERRFRGIFDQMFQFTGLLEPDGTVIEANQTALDFGGLTLEEVIGRPFWENYWWTISPQTQADLKAAIGRASQGELVRYEVEVLGKNGETGIIDFSIKPVKDENGAVTLLIPEGRNVTEVKRTQEKLDSTQRLFDLFMRHTPTATWIKDVELRYRYANPTFERELGVSAQWLLGKRDQDFLSEEIASALQHSDRQVLAQQQVQSLIEQMPHEGGKNAHTLVVKFPLTLEDGTPAVGGVSIDISSQVEAEEKLKMINQLLENQVKERTAQMEATEGELTRLVYSIAHDLRAPLRHMSAFAGMVQEDVGPRIDAENARRLQHIVGAAEKMGHLLDELLSYAKNDRIELRPEPVDLNQLVAELRQWLDPTADRILWQVAELPTLRADPMLMRQVWQNLLENAVKYTQHEPQPSIAVGCEWTEDQLILFVKDNGVGFNPQYQDKLFKLFQRLHANAEFEGTGLGLANVHRIATRHGGQVSAAGKVGEGATFFLMFPRTMLATG